MGQVELWRGRVCLRIVMGCGRGSRAQAWVTQGLVGCWVYVALGGRHMGAEKERKAKESGLNSTELSIK